MGKDDYSSTGGGLKLKGAKNAGIDKSKKKKKLKKPPTDATGDEPHGERTAPAEVPRPEDGEDVEGDADAATSRALGTSGEQQELLRGKDAELVGKTEAERRHDEMRRRRLNDRLAREGIKTHKERVEELNKYLSTLSEHHDMPRIGPG